jgi:hypothetical protein
VTLSGKGGRSDILETLEGEGGWAGTAIRKQDRQLGEKKEPSGGSKRITPERFRVASQGILSVTDHSERVQENFALENNYVRREFHFSVGLLENDP